MDLYRNMLSRKRANMNIQAAAQQLMTAQTEKEFRRLYTVIAASAKQGLRTVETAAADKDPEEQSKTI